MKLIVRETRSPRKPTPKPNVKAKRKRGWKGPHTWTKCPKTKPLILEAWQRLLDGGLPAKEVPSYLRGVCRFQEKIRPDFALGIVELIQDAEDILNDRLRPYKLQNRSGLDAKG